MSEHRRSSNTTRRHTDSGVRPAQVLRVQTAGRCVVSRWSDVADTALGVVLGLAIGAAALAALGGWVVKRVWS